MARIPNKADGDASSIWDMNDQYVAEYGGEWPGTSVTSARHPQGNKGTGMWTLNQQRNAKYGTRWPLRVPHYATGYASRTNHITSGDTNPATATPVNNWNVGGPPANYYQALSMRCTSHDWELNYWGQGNSANKQGLIYYEFRLWEGQYVNDTSKIVTPYSQNGAMWIPNNGTPAGQTMTYISSWEIAAARLTQNTWYTMGMAYTQNHYQSYHGNPTLWMSGGSYGTGLTTVTFDCTATNSAGTTTETATFEWANVAGSSSSTAPWTTHWLTNTTNGGFVTSAIKVFS